MPIPRVVIVDDDPGFGEFVRKVAQGCGYDALVMTEAATFLAEIARGQPDLIMLDLQMPDTDGVEVLRALADLGCTAAILVMSGFDAKVVDTARRLGAARGLKMGQVLTKPIRAADLRDVLIEFKQGIDSDAG